MCHMSAGEMIYNIKQATADLVITPTVTPDASSSLGFVKGWVFIAGSTAADPAG